MSGTAIPFAAQFGRLNRQPLDASEVFQNLPAFQTYLATGPAYPGQVVAVLNGTNEPDLFRINEDFTYDPVGEGADVSDKMDLVPTATGGHLAAFSGTTGQVTDSGSSLADLEINYEFTPIPPHTPFHAMLWGTPRGELYVFDSGLTPPGWIQLAGPTLYGGGGAATPPPAAFPFWFNALPPLVLEHGQLWATPDGRLHVYDATMVPPGWIQLRGV
jgi:hypothetical protein